MKNQNYYESLDKRTKEYKDYKQSKGLGDTIEKVLKKTGVKAIVEAITDDCGCDGRRDKLNEMFPRNVKAVRCMMPDQYKKYGKYIEGRTLNIWKDADITLLLAMYQYIFAIRYNPIDFCRTCQGTAKKLLKITTHLDEVYNDYNNK
tara:strand:- start:243 stop:683 length:441 start_codon:yes stop_codon:yes gene_type:complete